MRTANRPGDLLEAISADHSRPSICQSWNLRDHLRVQRVPDNPPRPLMGRAFNDSLRRDNQVDPEIMGSFRKLSIDHLQLMHRSCDEYVRTHQSSFLQKGHFNIRVASAFAESSPVRVDGHTAAYNQINGWHFIKAYRDCILSRCSPVGGFTGRNGKSFGIQKIEGLGGGKFWCSHVNPLPFFESPLSHCHLSFVRNCLDDTRRLPCRMGGEAESGGICAGEKRDASGRFGQYCFLTVKQCPYPFSNLLLFLPDFIGVHSPFLH